MKTTLSLKRPLAPLTAATVGAGAALAGTLASVCCVTPFLAPLMVGVLGVSGAVLASSMKPYSPYFFGGSFFLLVYAFWAVYRPVKNCADGECSTRSGRIVRIMLWTSASFWVVALTGTLVLLTRTV
jgi:hypothetical protein